MNRYLTVVWVIFLTFFLGCAGGLVKVIGKPKTTIVLSKDTTWEGVVVIEGPVFIPKGITLSIKPGTIVRFNRRRAGGDELKRHDIIDGTGLKVEGRILAIGSASLPIFFTSNQKEPQAGDWDKILINHSRGSVFDHCYVEFADFAFHAHFAEVVVKNSVIRFNNEGFRIGESHFTITRNKIEFNRSRGINFRSSRNDIFRNDITDNEVGIFLYENNQKSVIKENNFANNKDYDLRLGDFHTQDIELKNNWWGTINQREIAVKIWDKADDEAVGKAFIQPATQPWERRP